MPLSLRRITLTLLLLAPAHFACGSFSSGPPALSWAGNPEADIAGYRVYYRTAFEEEPRVIDVSNRTSVVLPDLIPETKYFCYLTAYNFFGLESSPSAEVVLFSRPNPPSLKLSGDTLRFSVSGKPGGTIDLFESTDLKQWKRVRTFINPTGEIDIEEEFDPSVAKKFFLLGTSGDTLEGWLAARGLTDPHASYQSGQGVSNIYAYSTGLDLVENSSEVQPTAGIQELPWEGRTETFSTFSYTIREGTRDVDPYIEMSHDLTSWFDASPSLTTLTSTLNGNGTRTITMRGLTPTSSNPHQRSFYRLRFGAPPLLSFESWLTSNAFSTSPTSTLDSAYAFASGADLLPNPYEALPKMGTYLSTATFPFTRYATLSFHVRDRTTGVTPLVEYTEDLENWLPASSITTPHSDLPNGDGTRTITLREVGSLQSNRTRYYRVKFVFSE